MAASIAYILLAVYLAALYASFGWLCTAVFVQVRNEAAGWHSFSPHWFIVFCMVPARFCFFRNRSDRLFIGPAGSTFQPQ